MDLPTFREATMRYSDPITDAYDYDSDCGIADSDSDVNIALDHTDA